MRRHVNGWRALEHDFGRGSSNTKRMAQYFKLTAFSLEIIRHSLHRHRRIKPQDLLHEAMHRLAILSVPQFRIRPGRTTGSLAKFCS